MRHAEFLFFITTSHPTSEHHNPYNLYKFAAVTATKLKACWATVKKGGQFGRGKPKMILFKTTYLTGSFLHSRKEIN